MHTLIISPIARDDLRKIYQYGTLNWGKARASRYIDHLKAQVWSLTEHPERGIERDELLSTTRSITIESHVIFYRTKNQQLEVIRVLHARQDPQRHIK